jgi:hypothetical protein
MDGEVSLTLVKNALINENLLVALTSQELSKWYLLLTNIDTVKCENYIYQSNKMEKMLSNKLENVEGKERGKRDNWHE